LEIPTVSNLTVFLADSLRTLTVENPITDCECSWVSFIGPQSEIFCFVG
jgi:hypothetical protein